MQAKISSSAFNLLDKSLQAEYVPIKGNEANGYSLRVEGVKELGEFVDLQNQNVQQVAKLTSQLEQHKKEAQIQQRVAEGLLKETKTQKVTASIDSAIGELGLGEENAKLVNSLLQKDTLTDLGVEDAKTELTTQIDTLKKEFPGIFIKPDASKSDAGRGIMYGNKTNHPKNTKGTPETKVTHDDLMEHVLSLDSLDKLDPELFDQFFKGGK